MIGTEVQAIGEWVVLSPYWFGSVLLYHISHWVTGPTETETSATVEVSGMKLLMASLITWCM
jgi:hypothetical protein